MLDNFDYRDICTNSNCSDISLEKIAQMKKFMSDKFQERIDAILTTYSAWNKFLDSSSLRDDPRRYMMPNDEFWFASIPLQCYNSSMEVWTEYLKSKDKKFGILLEDGNGKLCYWQSISSKERSNCPRS